MILSKIQSTKNDIKKIIVLLYAELSDILSVDKYIKIIQRGRDKK